MQSKQISTLVSAQDQTLADLQRIFGYHVNFAWGRKAADGSRCIELWNGTKFAPPSESTPTERPNGATLARPWQPSSSQP